MAYPHSITKDDVIGLDNDLETINTSLAALDARVTAEENEVGGSSLGAIAASLTGTAVAHCWYIPAMDSDPTWPERCQGHSWYVSDGPIPAVNLIIAESDSLTIYDGAVSPLEAWRTHDLTGFTVTSVKASHGKIIVGTTTGVIVLDYAAGSLDAELKYSTSTTPAIVNNVVNAVDITVRPDAPIDPVTGLPKATIPLGTGGGACCINHDGTVTDSSFTFAIQDVTATEHGLWYTHLSNLFFATWEDVQAGDGFGDAIGGVNAGSNTVDMLVRGKRVKSANGALVLGGDTASLDAVPGLMLHYPNYADQTKGMSALITSKYNTGGMKKPLGCFFCDTDDTDLTGSTLVDVDFSSYADQAAAEADGWLFGGGWSLSGGVATCDGTPASILQREVSVVAGETYVVTVDVTESTGIENNEAFAEFDAENLLLDGVGTLLSAGTYVLTYTATATGSVVIRARTSGGSDGDETLSVNNFTVKLAHPDRSVNNNGLIIHDEITVTEAAPGAEAVGYKPDAANPGWFEQPYNPALNVGTGAIAAVVWMYNDGTGSTAYAFLRKATGGSNQFFLLRNSSGGTMTVQGRIGSDLISTTELPVNAWTMAVLQRDEAGIMQLWMNDRLENETTNATTIEGIDQPLYALSGGGDGTIWRGMLSRCRIFGAALTPDEISRIYREERPHYQPGGKCTLYGTSDAVTALAHDSVTGLDYVGASGGMSVFSGLERIDEDAIAVTTSIAALGGRVVRQ